MAPHSSLSPWRFTPRDQREELMMVFANASYEQGYALTRLSDVAHRAGIDEAVVYGYWDSEEDCAVQTLDAVAERTFSTVAEAFMSTGGDCPLAAHRALSAMLKTMAAEPAALHLGAVELPRMGTRFDAKRKDFMEMYVEFLGPGFAAMGMDPIQPDVVSLILGGGIAELLRRHCLDRTIEQLPDCLPGVSYICIATFFGIEEARRVSGLPGWREVQEQGG
jgi:AcrR family transcriptional regulator